MDWAYYCTFVGTNPSIPHGAEAEDKEVSEMTLDTVIELAKELDKNLRQAKITKKAEKKRRKKLSLDLAYIWAMRGAVEERNGRTEAALTCLENVSYYLKQCKKMKSNFLEEMKRHIHVDDVDDQKQQELK